jgi:K+-sensing histidine kinase KdpD
MLLAHLTSRKKLMQLMKKNFNRYLFSFLITCVAIWLQFIIIYHARIPVPGILYPSAFLIAWFYGFGPTVMSIILGSLAANYLFYEPRYSFKLLEFEDKVRVFIYFATSLLSSWIVARGKEATIRENKVASELKDLQERFKRSSLVTNLGIWYCDLPFDILVWNNEVKEHFWLPSDAVVTLDIFYERIHPDDRERTRAAISNSIENHGPYDITYRTTNPINPSQIKQIRAIGWTEYDVNNKPLRFDGITLDNTHLRKISDERDESLEILETLNNVGKTLSAELDQQKLVQSVTDSATQLTKAEFGAFFYNVTNVEGESYTLYTISGVPREMFTSFPTPRNTKIFAPTFSGESIVRSDDITQDSRYGKSAPFFGMPKGHLPVRSYLAVPVVSRSGEVIGGLFFGHKEPAKFSEKEEKLVSGLAAQVAISMDNAKLFEKAQQAIQVRDEFLSISSHELRTPLTPLKMQLQSMTKLIEKDKLKDFPEERLKKMLATSERQVSRLTSLIDDLLDVSRITSGKMKLNLEQVDLTEVITDLCDRYQPQILAAKCELKLSLAPNLNGNVDKLRFEQIFINLLTNAIKYANGYEGRSYSS